MVAAGRDQRTTCTDRTLKNMPKHLRKSTDDAAQKPYWKRMYEEQVPESIKLGHTITYKRGSRLSSHFEGWVVYRKKETLLLMTATGDKDYILCIREDGTQKRYSNKGKRLSLELMNELDKKDAEAVKEKRQRAKKDLEERL